jgi:opacity protein-like surface antigen
LRQPEPASERQPIGPARALHQQGVVLKRSLFAVALVGMALVSFEARAQVSTVKPVQFGISGGAALPTSDLSDISNTGWNANGHLSFNPVMIPVGIRIDGGYSRFGFKEGVEGDIHFGNVTGNLVYKIPAAPVSPYLLGGGGWYRVGASVPGFFSGSENKFGWNIGGGINLPLSGFDTFIEAKYTQIQTEDTPVKYIPITFGVMF